MNYGKIIYYDIANGLGCRTVLFVSGCRHHCKGCFNPETWNFKYGTPFTEKTLKNILNSLDSTRTDGLSILGGEPMEPENQPVIEEIVTRVKKEKPDQTIWIYSGYTWEELHDKNSICHTKHTKNILNHIDVLVDGEFILEKKNIMLAFRGSENQRIIDVPHSLQTGNLQVLSL
jgi:anaerobic ribonucleoside-triphosphate reductase activating protein